MQLIPTAHSSVVEPITSGLALGDWEATDTLVESCFTTRADPIFTNGYGGLGVPDIRHLHDPNYINQHQYPSTSLIASSYHSAHGSQLSYTIRIPQFVPNMMAHWGRADVFVINNSCTSDKQLRITISGKIPTYNSASLATKQEIDNHSTLSGFINGDPINFAGCTFSDPINPSTTLYTLANPTYRIRSDSEHELPSSSGVYLDFAWDSLNTYVLEPSPCPTQVTFTCRFVTSVYRSTENFNVIISLI